MLFKLKYMAVILVASLSLSATALPLSEYNLILFEDYNFQGGDVEGKALIGGDVSATGYGAVFGAHAVNFEDTLSVVGNINATNVTVEKGDVVYGGTLNIGNLNMNSGGTVTQDTSLSILSVKDELEAASVSYSSLLENGDYDELTKELSYTGSEPVAVFDVSASDIFAMNNSLKLDSGSAESVIINVSGTDIVAGGGVNLTDGFRHSDIGASNIIWNFYEAINIDFQNIAMFGSVLATKADVTGGSVFDGAFAANSYTGAREFHKFLFEPPVSIEVSEPGSLILFALGLVALFTQRKRLSRIG